MDEDQKDLGEYGEVTVDQTINGVSPWDRMEIFVKSYNVFSEEKGRRRDDDDNEE